MTASAHMCEAFACGISDNWSPHVRAHGDGRFGERRGKTQVIVLL